MTAPGSYPNPYVFDDALPTAQDLRSTLQVGPGGIQHLVQDWPARHMQLIQRDFNVLSPTYGQDLFTFDILGPNAGAQGVTLLKTFTGFYHAPRTPIRESWAYQEGSTPGDFPRVEERLLDFRLATKGRTTREWEIIESLLWDTLLFTQDCVLRVESQTSPPRELKIRLDRKPKDTFDFDPGMQKYLAWDVTAVACDPWWHSPTLTSSWTNTNGTGEGFVTLQNPGDVECWTQWACSTIYEPQVWTLPDSIYLYTSATAPTTAQIGQNVTHTLPSLGPAQEFLVDTYPLNVTLQVMDGSQQWANMHAESFLYPIPPNTPPITVPVSVVGADTTATITAYMDVRNDRPWG